MATSVEKCSENVYNQYEDFQIADNDNYDARCGEVFITLNRVLVFHCSLCDGRFGSYGNFLEHLKLHYDKVYDDTIIIDDDSCKDEADTKDILHEYTFDELCPEAENDEEYDGFLQMHEFEGDYIKPELVQIEEEYLDEIEHSEIENVEHIDESLDDVFEIKDDIEIEATISPAKKKKPSALPRIRFKKFEVLKCNQCDKVFETRQKLNKHKIIHSTERKHKCKICGFAFKERSNLNAHERRHTGEKSIGCSICSKKFFTRTEAATHMRTHTGERPYICSYCGMAFTTSGGLSEHVKRHNNVRPHKCNYCDKRFYDSCQLKDHMPVHTNERPFICAICSASFARRKSLLVHTKLHINAREYECNLCEKSFNQKPALLAHIKINHKVVERTKVCEFD